MKRLVLLAAILLTACAASASTRDAPPFARVADPLPQGPTGWVELTPTPVEIDGRVIDATCSHAPGTDPAYRFWARRGTENGLVIYFDGGGACWDDITCAVPLLASSRNANDGFYKAELLPGDDPNRMRGIFDLANPANPVRNWSFVFVPYCTGDVHSGANAAHYRDPDTGEPYTIAHKGADNFRVVLEWIRANFDAPETL
ncbi:MAG: pectin acetylesterase-family hydrolase, partial [Vitreimonas sp.]